MAKINPNYNKLSAGYLFPEIAKRAHAYQEQNPGIKLLKLGIGNTTEPLPPAVIQGLHFGVEKLAKPETYSGYGDDQGDKRLRDALKNLYAKYGVSLDADEIFISDGAKPDSGNIQSIFALDNVVAVQDPAYPVYVDTNVIAGRSGLYDSKPGLYEGLVYMPCTEQNGFFPDLPEKKVDMIYICSPNNPTGAVATKSQLKKFIDYAVAHRAVIVFDAAYGAYIKDPSLPKSIYQVENAKKCAIEINSFSKSAGFTGVRLGWSVVPTELVVQDTEPGRLQSLWFRRQCTFFNGASNIAQEGGIAVLSDQGQKECQTVVDYYMENAGIIRTELGKLGLVIYGGENAPYIWMKTPANMSSWDFFDKLLRETHVIGTPGSGFGPSGEGFIRLSSFGHRKDIMQAVNSIKNNLKLS